jgi:uncharacterized membrane protein
VHNTYFTLPVVIAMLSNHYGWMTQAPHNWLVLLVMMLAGALIRQFFVLRHKTKLAGKPAPWGYAIVGVLLIIGVAVALRPAPQPTTAAAATLPPPSFAQAQAIFQQRCVVCHNAQLQNKGIELDSPDFIRKNALAWHQQAVVLKTMPLNNATQITDEERALLGRWFDAGMPGLPAKP